MLHESMDYVGQDLAAVSAVRGGDVERYRELVERHERRVFAVAWNRLGDATLAEEATQEAFIRGYRRLWLLGDGAKFAGWITSIARHAAINLGLRRRRELNKRQRWSLEQTVVSEPSAGESTAPCTPEMLRQTLEELPAAHREGLVLFYLEGKSGEEAAAALGISEAAFRVRLHRARGLLREQLETKLEASLRELRPAKSLVPAVMAAVLVSTSAKAATAGGTLAAGACAKVLAALGKTFICSWLGSLVSVVGALPSVAFTSWVGGVERRNYREPYGFRARMHRDFYRSFVWGYVLLVVLAAVFARYAVAAWGIRGLHLFLVTLLVALTLISARSLTIARNPFHIGMFAYGLILTAGTGAIVLGWVPQRMAQLPMLLGTVLFIFFLKYRPVRMDYSLYLRAAQGLLRSPANPEPEPPADNLDRSELLAFARFLGFRWLVNNFRWEAGGLALRLPPVRTSFMVNMASVLMPPVSRGFSRILLKGDGMVAARCSSRDERALTGMRADQCAEAQELGRVVEAAAALAWREFRAGHPALAERMLGELPESEVFVVPPARARSMRWWRVFLGGTVLLMIAALTVPYWIPASWSGLSPVSITEAQVRAFLGNIRSDPTPVLNKMRRSDQGDPVIALDFCVVLPPTNLFTQEALRAVRQEVFRYVGFDPQSEASSRLSAFRGAWLLHKAMEGGWVDWIAAGLKPQDATVYFHHLTTNEWQFMLSPEQSWSWVKSERFTVERLSDFTLNQLRWLRYVNCVDLVDRAKLIRQIAAVQVLSSTSAPGQPPIHDWRDVRGLFFTPCWPALLDTYYSLAALELLGGLDEIDREQCIRGILRQHRGKGYFTSPDSGGYNEYHVEGDARDTFAAFESLRILGAQNRVKDLDRWQFRPQRRGVAKGKLAWNDVEAWVCQQRLEKILHARKENPQAPVRSLLQE
jgi:RNA polymerase sigma-70 factor (ECF subfamily)